MFHSVHLDPNIRHVLHPLRHNFQHTFNCIEQIFLRSFLPAHARRWLSIILVSFLIKSSKMTQKGKVFLLDHKRWPIEPLTHWLSLVISATGAWIFCDFVFKTDFTCPKVFLTSIIIPRITFSSFCLFTKIFNVSIAELLAKVFSGSVLSPTYQSFFHQTLPQRRFFHYAAHFFSDFLID